MVISKHKPYTLYILFFVVFFISFFVVYQAISKEQYIHSYKTIPLEKVAQSSGIILEANQPVWIPLTSLEAIHTNEINYSVQLPDVDLQKYMIVKSYHAELKKLEYNTHESTYKSRGYYIGFPEFGQEDINTVFFYVAPVVPLYDAETAGFPPDYHGRYR